MAAVTAQESKLEGRTERERERERERGTASWANYLHFLLLETVQKKVENQTVY